jgi:hypothetical protein
MSQAKRSKLIETCTAFAVCGFHKTLHKFQKLQGWINWTLNVYPHLHPALCKSYHKIISKAWPNAPIRVNNFMRHELLWFIDHISNSDGVHMLQSVEWSPYDRMASTLVAYCDASGIGMGIWSQANTLVFSAPYLPKAPKI